MDFQISEATDGPGTRAGAAAGPVHFIRDEYVLTQRVDQRQGALVVLFHAASGSLQRVDQREVVVESEKP